MHQQSAWDLRISALRLHYPFLVVSPWDVADAAGAGIAKKQSRLRSLSKVRYLPESKD